MTWDQLKDMRQAGNEIGSHTMTHANLSGLANEEAIIQELKQSKDIIEHKLGKVVDSLCYPFGHFDNRVLRIAADCRYKLAFAVVEGTSSRIPELFCLRRNPILADYSLRQFKRRLSPYYGLTLWGRALEYKLRSLIKKRPSFE